MKGRVFGREPVLITAFVAALLQAVSAFVLPLTDEQQGLLNGAVALALGLVAAAAVSFEKAVPAIIALLQGVAAVAVGFGLEIRPEQVSVISVLIAAGAALWTRTQVVAPVPPIGSTPRP